MKCWKTYAMCTICLYHRYSFRVLGSGSLCLQSLGAANSLSRRGEGRVCSWGFLLGVILQLLARLWEKHYLGQMLRFQGLFLEFPDVTSTFTWQRKSGMGVGEQSLAVQVSPRDICTPSRKGQEEPKKSRIQADWERMPNTGGVGEKKKTSLGKLSLLLFSVKAFPMSISREAGLWDDLSLFIFLFGGWI